MEEVPKSFVFFCTIYMAMPAVNYVATASQTIQREINSYKRNRLESTS